jgi:hypothetical protein
MPLTNINNGDNALEIRNKLNEIIAVVNGLGGGNSTELGISLSSMTTANAAAANGAALTADIIAAAAAGIKEVWVLPGNYNYGGGSIGTAAVDITFAEASEVYLRFMPGAKLTVNTSGKNSTNVCFWFREGVKATIDGCECDGGTIAEIFARTTDVSATPGCELTLKNCRLYNFGWTTSDSATAGSGGTVGALLANGKRLVVENCQMFNFRAKENGTYGDQPGKCTFVQAFNNASGVQNEAVAIIDNCEFDAGAETNEADDYDHIHMLQQSGTAILKSVTTNCRFKFHGKTRRVWKFQGGKHKVLGCSAEPTTTCLPSTTGQTSIVVTAATEANPGVFTTGSTNSIPFGRPIKFSAFAGGTWASVNNIEVSVVPLTSTTFNVFGPFGAPVDTTGFGTLTTGIGSGFVQRASGIGQSFQISAATQANPGVFTTNYGVVNYPHGFVDGELVQFQSLAGGTWATLNGINYCVVVVSPTSFSLRLPALLDTSGTGPFGALGTYTGSSGSLTRVNGVTNEGMAGIDCAGTNAGLVEVADCYLDFRGFRNGVVQSIGKGSSLHLKDSILIGNRYDSNRFIPDTGANEVGLPIGWSTNSDDIDSSLVNCDVYGWARGVSPAGKNNKIVNNRFYDPGVYWCELGTAARDGLVVEDNEVHTITPYSLDASTDNVTADFHRMGSFRNWTNMRVNRNRLLQRGNTLHAPRFISFVLNGATGEALDNKAPDGCLEVSYSSGVAALNVRTAVATAGAATLSSLAGRITTEALTTAAGDTPYTLVITNDKARAGDLVLPTVENGTNNAGVPLTGRATAGSGTVTILIYNKHASAAFNGTLVVGFRILKA